jgi:HSP20 family protein
VRSGPERRRFAPERSGVTHRNAERRAGVRRPRGDVKNRRCFRGSAQYGARQPTSGTAAALLPGDHDARYRGDVEGPGPARHTTTTEQEKRTMTLVRFLPGRSRELSTLRNEMDQLFDSFLTNRPFYTGAEAPDLIAPPVDVVETAEGFEIHVDLPGMTEKDVKVSLVGDTLTLRGERKRETETKAANVHRTERVFGMFERTFTLPAPVRADKVKASYRNGVLEIHVPKAEEAKVREIEVQVG